jgi:hypothetical protein
MEPDSEALQGDASASLPPETEGYPAAAPSDAAAEREPRPNRALGLPYEIIASELAERQQQPAPRGKRSVKSEDADDEPYYPGSSKRSKVRRGVRVEIANSTAPGPARLRSVSIGVVSACSPSDRFPLRRARAAIREERTGPRQLHDA